MKSAVIFNPYWDTLGGGEKYVATVALAYEQAGYNPLIAWHDKSLPAKLRDRFNLDFKRTKIDPSLFNLYTKSSTITKLRHSTQFDSFFWVSDGSIPLLASKINLLHFQVPFHHHIGVKEKIKLKNFDHILCNSRFTKNIIDHTFSCRSQVLYPPVTLMKPAAKTNTILSVGRFDNILHAKRQDVLIQAFKQLNLPGWKLILAGGSLAPKEQQASLAKFIDSADIEIILNPSFTQLSQLYGQAKIYWHAAGFGSNLTKSPEKAEHFGISTVEAMSAGAIPIVFAGGGQLEIIKHGVNGFLWKNVPDLVQQTRQIISGTANSDPIINEAVKTASSFSQSQFIKAFQQYAS